jgi:ubiquitin-like-conjugating enzyme ATG10
LSFRLPENDDELIIAFGKMGRLEDNTLGDMEIDIPDDEVDEVCSMILINILGLLLRANTYHVLTQQALHSQPATGGSALPPYSLFPLQPWVKYEIYLHPIYQLPCLWFDLHDLPMGESPLDLDSVYRYLVPDQEKTRMRGLGVQGGISMAHHPVTEVPAFFVHPCLTKEAMEEFSCQKEEYLMVWLGLVGPVVGLWLPSQMAMTEIKGEGRAS